MLYRAINQDGGYSARRLTRIEEPPLTQWARATRLRCPARVNTNSGCSPRQSSITDLAIRFKTTYRSSPFFTKTRA
jgi:hypothetical protein